MYFISKHSVGPYYVHSDVLEAYIIYVYIIYMCLILTSMEASVPELNSIAQNQLRRRPVPSVGYLKRPELTLATA